MQVWSNPQIFKTSSRFLEYRRFEARRAVFCSISAYEESKLPETSFTGRALYAFYSWCKISASEARICTERKISIVWVKKSWHFYPSLSLLPSFFFILVPFLRPENLLGRISVGKVYGIRRKDLQVGSGGFSSPYSGQRYIFFVFLFGLKMQLCFWKLIS